MKDLLQTKCSDILGEERTVNIADGLIVIGRGLYAIAEELGKIREQAEKHFKASGCRKYTQGETRIEKRQRALG